MKYPAGFEIKVRDSEFFEYLKLVTGNEGNIYYAGNTLHVTQEVFDKIKALTNETFETWLKERDE